MMFKRRLWLVGDDEVLDAIADLSRHLDYFQVARLEELPEPPLDDNDHVLISMIVDERTRDLVAQVTTLGSPGHVASVPSLPGKTTGARAIVAAASLVALF